MKKQTNYVEKYKKYVKRYNFFLTLTAVFLLFAAASFFFFPRYAQTAIAPSSVTSGGAINTSSVIVLHGISGIDRILLVGVSSRHSNAVVQSVTYGGFNLSLVGSRYAGSNTTRVGTEIWQLLSPPVGTNNVVVTMSGTVTSASVGAISFSGVDQLVPLGMFASAIGSGTAASLSTPSATGEIVLDVLAFQNDGVATPAISQTVQWHVKTGTLATHVGGSGSIASGTPTTATSWTISGTGRNWSIGGVSVRPSGGTTPDTVPPARSNGQPAGTLPAGTTSAVVSLTTDESATCRYSTVSGTPYSSMVNMFSTTGGAVHSTTITGLTSGNTYNYYARCEDAARNVNTDDFPITFSVAAPDTITPSVSVTAPTSGSTVFGTTVIAATASDNIGVMGVQFLLDGANLGTEDSTAPYSVSWNTAAATNGSHALAARARDAAGNATTSAGVTVTVNNTTTTSDFICTEVLGFSQTVEWFSQGGFENVPGINRDNWQARLRGGAGIEQWTDPNFVGYTDDSYLASRCAINSTIPDRVILTITSTVNTGEIPPTSQIYPKTQVSDWLPDMNTAVATIRSRYPNVKQIVLQPVIGGPNHNTCFDQWGTPVRASVNHPIIDQAISIVAGSVDTIPPTRSGAVPQGKLLAGTTQATLGLSTLEAVIAGISPEARTCGDYEDSIGHQTVDAAIYQAGNIGNYYATLPLVGNATCRYSAVPGTAYSSMANTFSTTGGAVHSTTITGLTSGNTYNYYARCEDAARNVNTDDFPITFSVAAPGSLAYLDDLYGTVIPLFAAGDELVSSFCSPSGPAGCFHVGLSVAPAPQGACSGGGCSGGWQTNFTVSEQSNVTISFFYNLVLSGNTETGEFSRLYYRNPATGLAVLAAQLQGASGDTANHTTSGVVTNTYNLAPGTYTFDAGCWHNDGVSSEYGECFIDDVVITSSTAPPDVTSPTVSVSSPLSGSTVSGAITVSALASDNVGVAGVQFVLDGVNLGTEDLSAPHSVSWNTATVGNGLHTLTARARDAAGNTATSAAVTVTVSNAASTKFVVGNRVVVSSGPLNVRDIPSVSGILLGTQATGAQGTVLGGPTFADGFSWWNIDYDTGADGWSVEDFLEIPLPPPGPTSAFIYADDIYGTVNPSLAAGDEPVSSFCSPSGPAGCFHVGLSVAPSSQGICSGSGCSGGWRADFTVPQQGNVAISFFYNLVLSGNTETGEFSRLYYRNPATGLAVLAAQLQGASGDTANHTTSGVVTNTYNLAPGTYTFDAGCWHNDGASSEYGECFIDDIVIGLQ